MWFELPVSSKAQEGPVNFYKWVRCLLFESGHIFAMPVI